MVSPSTSTALSSSRSAVGSPNVGPTFSGRKIAPGASRTSPCRTRSRPSPQPLCWGNCSPRSCRSRGRDPRCRPVALPRGPLGPRRRRTVRFRSVRPRPQRGHLASPARLRSATICTGCCSRAHAADHQLEDRRDRHGPTQTRRDPAFDDAASCSSWRHLRTYRLLPLPCVASRVRRVMTADRIGAIGPTESTCRPSSLAAALRLVLRWR